MISKTPLTDKQRKWLNALTYSDTLPFPKTVQQVIRNNGYSDIEGANLRKLVVYYKQRHK